MHTQNETNLKQASRKAACQAEPFTQKDANVVQPCGTDLFFHVRVSNSTLEEHKRIAVMAHLLCQHCISPGYDCDIKYIRDRDGMLCIIGYFRAPDPNYFDTAKGVFKRQRQLAEEIDGLTERLNCLSINNHVIETNNGR